MLLNKHGDRKRSREQHCADRRSAQRYVSVFKGTQSLSVPGFITISTLQALPDLSWNLILLGFMQSTMVWIPVLLVLTLATAIAPLCAVFKGWAYYQTGNYNGISLQIWVRITCYNFADLCRSLHPRHVLVSH